MSKEQSFKLSKLVEKLSHELRTPLNAILGYSELLEKSENLDANDKKHLENIAESGSELLDVINDIIEISNIESGKTEIEYKSFDPKSLKHDLETKFSPAVRLKDLNLHLNFHKSINHSFKCDVRKTKSILYSLVNNAIKFTEEGEVSIDLSLTDVRENEGKARLNILVKDTGIGISEDDLNHIFKPFWQVPSESKSGTGLGLTTATKLLNLLGGEIQVESKRGKGTSVQLSIPVNLIEKSTVFEDSPSINRVDRHKVKGLRALIVDDLPLNRTLARIMLEMKEFETVEAENGKEAIDYFHDTKPDVVLMDISMPVMDGIEAMEKIRMIKEKNGQDIPIIAITAGGHAGSRNDLIQKGFSEYIQKPYREKELFEKISLFLPVQAKNGTKPSLKHPSVRA